LPLLAEDVYVYRTSRTWTIELQEEDVLPSASDQSTIFDWEDA